MASRSLNYLCAIGAVLALSGCAGVTTSGGGMGVLACAAADCPVPVSQKFAYFNLQLPDTVSVDTPRPVKMTWTLTPGTLSDARFDHDKGIKFENPDWFKCAIHPTNALVYICVNNAPKNAPNEKYKYSVTTVGFGSPPTIDPFVVNN